MKPILTVSAAKARVRTRLPAATVAAVVVRNRLRSMDFLRKFYRQRSIGCPRRSFVVAQPYRRTSLLGSRAGGKEAKRRHPCGCRLLSLVASPALPRPVASRARPTCAFINAELGQARVRMRER